MNDASAGIDVSFLFRRASRKRIGITVGVFLVLGLLYAFLAPRWYRSEMTVVPVSQGPGGALSSMIAGQLGGLANIAGDFLGDSDVQRIEAVLTSNEVSRALIDKFGLRDRYDKDVYEDAFDELWKHCGVNVMIKASLVEFWCEDKDPKFAQAMAKYFAEYGNQVFQRVGVSTASEQVRFLEKRVVELRAQAEDTAARMRAFQEEHQIIDLDTQAKAVVGAIASLNSQRISKQLELDYARTFAAGDEATARQLESQLAIVNNGLATLEQDPVSAQPTSGSGPGKGRRGNSLFPPALRVPKLRAEYETLVRDRKVSEMTLVFALERLEAAKAEQARETSTFLLLDPPTLPTRHARPKRKLVVAASLMLGLLLACGVEWMRATGRYDRMKALLRSPA